MCVYICVRFSVNIWFNVSVLLLILVAEFFLVILGLYLFVLFCLFYGFVFFGEYLVVFLKISLPNVM